MWYSIDRLTALLHRQMAKTHFGSKVPAGLSAMVYHAVSDEASVWVAQLHWRRRLYVIHRPFAVSIESMGYKR